MGIKQKRLVIFIFFHLFHLSSFLGSLVSGVQEKSMGTIRPTEESLVGRNKEINSVSKRGTSAGRGFTGVRGTGGYKGGTGGKTYGGSDGDIGGSTSTPRTPGTNAIIPVYTAGAANRHTTHHSDATGPQHNQVRVAILASLLLVFSNVWM